MRFILLLLLTLSTVYAGPHEPFKADHWSTGVHLLAGGGVNAVHSYSDDRRDDIGYGINIKTDLGYYVFHNLAAEWSSNVKFNQIDGYQVWDSLFTLGLRYRIHDYFVRAFAGRSPTVIFFNGNVPEEFKDTNASRLQYDGPVYGVSFGKTFETESGKIWFLEASGTLQTLRKREAIHMDGDVPEVVRTEIDEALLSTLYLMIGMVVF